MDVREESATLPTAFSGGPSRWWEWLVDTAAPIQTWMAAMNDVERERAMIEISEALRQYDDGRPVNVPINVIVGSGHKPV